MSDRSNNGVKSKVTHDVGRGSINRGEGQAGKMAEEGGNKSTGAEISERYRAPSDMRAITGSKGSSGTEKDFGGVGNYTEQEEDQDRDFFKDKH